MTLLLVPYLHGGVSFDGFANYGFRHAYTQLVTSHIVWQVAAGAVLGLVYRSRIEIRSETTLKLLLFVTAFFVLWQYMWRFRMGRATASRNGACRCCP